jgi:putative addiction module killer protein
MAYNPPMFEIVKSDEFVAWVSELRDRRAAMRIAARLDGAALGNLGDWKSLREGISEMRIDVGAGYRLYFTRRGRAVVVLLCGGDKRSQKADIERAIALARTWEYED